MSADHSASPHPPQRGHAAPTSEWEDEWADGGDALPFKALSREEAQRWRERHPAPSVWRVVAWQAGLTVAVTALSAVLVALWWPGRWAVVASVAYGGVSVLVPAAVMAWGMTSSALARWLRAAAPGVPRASLVGWLWWEGVKVALALAMLATAPRWIPDLSWLGLVVGLVVVLKSYWLAWIVRPAARGPIGLFKNGNGMTNGS